MEIFRGTYLRSIFRNEQDGFTIFMVNTTKEYQRIRKFSGEIPAYTVGTPLYIEAEKDPKGSDLMVVKSINESTIDIPKSDLKQFYLDLGVPIRIAINLAKREDDFYRLIFDYQFVDSFIQSFPAGMEVLRKAKLPAEERMMRDFLYECVGNKCPKYNLIHRFCAENTGISMAMLSSYTYKVCERNFAMDFAEADKVASRMSSDSRANRVEGMIISVMKDEERNGSTAADINKVVDKVMALCGDIGETFPPTPIEIENALKTSLFLDAENHAVSFDKTFLYEKYAAHAIYDMKLHRKILYADDELKSIVSSIEKELNMQYAVAQKRAFNLLRHTGVSILTGGPGTGKTTCVNGLIKAFKKKFPDKVITLCAPTGRAAQRMSETTGMEASTIHRLLGIGTKQCGEVQLASDFVICDESSMLDTEMVAYLFKSVSPDSLLLLVGDVDQLPSVGAGDVLADLIESKRLPVCKLETVFRQSGESKIVVNANAINNGEDKLQMDNTFTVETKKTDEELQKAAINVFLHNSKCQMLCPSHKGLAGIQTLNKTIQDIVNPKQSGSQTVRFGSTEFRKGDRIIMTQNNYEGGYFNGDMGVIKDISPTTVNVLLENKEIELKKQELGDMSLAYCISIHKSQGSEFETCCIVLPAHPSNMLKRNLLYTGITRAKKNCIILEQEGCISKCVNTIEKGNRMTRLRNLIAL